MMLEYYLMHGIYGLKYKYLFKIVNIANLDNDSYERERNICLVLMNELILNLSTMFLSNCRRKKI